MDRALPLRLPVQLDEGNLGAVARSAYFLGVDAIVTQLRKCAPWSQIALKASAGAAEAVPIFGVSNDELSFVQESAKAGWHIYAAAAAPTLPGSADALSPVAYTASNAATPLTDHAPLQRQPALLMLGSEGEGLAPYLLRAAHYRVGVRRMRPVDEVGVDSLNVSVAAALICSDMLRGRRAATSTGEKLW